MFCMRLNTSRPMMFKYRARSRLGQIIATCRTRRAFSATAEFLVLLFRHGTSTVATVVNLVRPSQVHHTLRLLSFVTHDRDMPRTRINRIDLLRIRLRQLKRAVIASEYTILLFDRRMCKFEEQLSATVDSILEILNSATNVKSSQ